MRERACQYLLLLSLCVFAAASHAVTLVQLQSDPGDPFGFSNTVLAPPASTVTVNEDGNSTISVDVTTNISSLHLQFSPRASETLIGTAHVMPQASPGTNYSSLSISAGGPPFCVVAEGAFIVSETVGTPGNLTQLALDFQLRCTGAMGFLHGQIRFNSAVAIQPAPIALASGPDYVDEGDNVVLNGALSFVGQHPFASYSWRQLSGPAVTLSSTTAIQPSFVATAVAGSISPLIFELYVTDTAGGSATSQHTVNVYSATTPRTVAAYQSDPGEYVVAGQSLEYRDTDTPMSTTFTSTGFDALQIEAGLTIQLQSPLQAPLQPGNYLNAYQTGGGRYPGLTISGFARECNDALGQFTIYEIQYDNVAHKLQKLALDFDRHCTSNPDSPARAYGQVRINSTVPLVRPGPNAAAGSAQEVAEQTTVQLDGSGSRPGRNPIATWSWAQTSGPAVSLSATNISNPTFLAPAAAAGSLTLTFTLTVSDAFGNSATDQVTVNVVSASTPRNLLYVDSSPSDFIGQGQQATFDENNSLATVTASSMSSVTIDVAAGTDNYGLQFSAPAGQTLTADNYENVRTGGGPSPLRPGMNINALGRGCDVASGRFVVREIAFDPSTGQLSRLAVDALQYCDGPAPLQANLRFNSSIPLNVAAPTAAAGADQDVLERDDVVLDGSNTLPGTGTISSYQWVQITGTPVTLANATSAITTFTAPKLIASGETLTFELQVASSNGTKSSDRLDVRVHQKTEPRTFAILASSVGDFIGRGQNYFLDPYIGLFTSPGLGAAGEAAHIRYQDGPDQWQFDFILNISERLAVGSYAVDTATSLSPSMKVSYGAGGCDNTRGNFKILDIAFTNNVVTSLAIDFQQYCDASTGPLNGQLRYNVVLPDANAGADQSVASGAQASLTGAASVAAVGTIQSYFWSQTSGPAATISNLNSATASFIAPSVASGSTPAVLVFQLTVTDDRGISDNDTVSVTVTPAAAAPPPPPAQSSGGGSGGGGTISLLQILALLCVLLARQIQQRRILRPLNVGNLGSRRFR